MSQSPLIEARNTAERLRRQIKRAEAEEEQRKVDIENRRIERLPYWVSPLSDYLPIDAGMVPGDEELDEEYPEDVR